MENIEKSTEKAREFYQALQRHDVGKNIYAIRSFKFYDMTGSEFAALVKALNYVPTSTTVKIFQRISVGTIIYHSAVYKRASSRNSYTVLYMYMENNILLAEQVKFYFQHHFRANTNCDESCTGTSNFAKVMKMPRDTEHPPIVRDPFTKATGFHLTIAKAPSRDPELVAVPLSNISQKCIIIQLRDSATAYVTYFPNRWTGCCHPCQWGI